MTKNIWYVDLDDLSCAWTKKEDAITYIEKSFKKINYSFEQIENLDNIIIYEFYDDNGIGPDTMAIRYVVLDKREV